jgi:hypothetical protein
MGSTTVKIKKSLLTQFGMATGEDEKKINQE